MPIDIMAIFIGTGLAIGLLFAEFFGIAAGGMVVPGYLAFHLTKPLDVLFTVLAALITFLLVKVISPFYILYGRRRTALMILVGYLVGMAMRTFLPEFLDFITAEYAIIGYIIPGLLAIWLDRQGIVETLATLVIVSVLIRLALILTLGEDITV